MQLALWHSPLVIAPLFPRASLPSNRHAPKCLMGQLYCKGLQPSASVARVLLVRDWLHPVGAAVGACGRIDCDVDHEGLRSCSVPVLLAGGKIDNICGAYLDDRFALSLRPPFSSDDVEDLAFGVRMPVGACPGLEKHAENPGARRRISGRCVHPDGASKPLRRSAPGLH